MKLKLKSWDEAVLKEFKGMVVVKETDMAVTREPVPVIWGDEDKASILNHYPVGALQRDAIANGDGNGVSLGYSLRLQAMFQDDMNEILEQVLCKFYDPVKITVDGASKKMRLDTLTSNDYSSYGDPIKKIKWTLNFWVSDETEDTQ